MRKSIAAVIDKHRAAGRSFAVGGANSFVLDQGDGVPVVCLHGVPASSFLYRKVLSELADRGLRGVAFDFPGLGLADRPSDFDYSWSGLARWTAEAIEALGIDRCHLLVHDIGGPIGVEFAIRHPEQVLSLTVLNSPLDVGVFHRPWAMHPFSLAGVGEIWLASMRPPVARWIFRAVGIADKSALSNAEVDAYFSLMRHGDGGRAFLKIMRGFELSQEKQDFFYQGLAERPYPAQVVWGELDKNLGSVRRAAVMEALGVTSSALLPASHFLQEDQAPAIASAVATLARETGPE